MCWFPVFLFWGLVCLWLNFPCPTSRTSICSIALFCRCELDVRRPLLLEQKKLRGDLHTSCWPQRRSCQVTLVCCLRCLFGCWPSSPSSHHTFSLWCDASLLKLTLYSILTRLAVFRSSHFADVSYMCSDRSLLSKKKDLSQARGYGMLKLIDEEVETLGAPESENCGFGFSVPRMRHQPIFEANSGYVICLLRFRFSIVSGNLIPFLASKIGSVSTVFKRALGRFFVPVSMEVWC